MGMAYDETTPSCDALFVKNACVHNLKSITCSIPHNAFVCLTGVSGSGKSSFAFDTLYAEGQRRYILALSHQAKRLVQDLPKPDVEAIHGLTPTVAIEQKSAAANPRSTVATMTEIHDYLRLLYARAAVPHCPETKEPLIRQTRDSILKESFRQVLGKKVVILAPYTREKKGISKEDLFQIERKGFTKVRLDGEIVRLDELPDIEKESTHSLDIVIDRLQVEDSQKDRFHDSLSLALEQGNGNCLLVTPDDELPFSIDGYSQSTHRSYSKLEPFDFSFNSPAGMCPECQGLGETRQFLVETLIDENASIAEDCCSLATSYKTIRYRNIYDNLASLFHFSVHDPWKKLSEEAKKIFLYGTEKKWTRMLFIHPHTGATWHDTIQWRGVLHEALTRYTQATSERLKRKMEEFMVLQRCPSCHGGRLKPYPLAALFHGKSIHDMCRLSVKEALSFLTSLPLPPEENPVAWELVKNIRSRLRFLFDVGLGYLTLDRSAPTLSGGEAQRVRLASHLGSGLVGLTYILDEPSIGLHPVDNRALIQALHSLKEKGNTVLVVEHDEETIRSSDYILDFGPQAGIYGGQLLHAGPFSALLSSSNSLTGDYLAGRKTIMRKTKLRAPSSASLILEGASLNTLKGDPLHLPIGLLIAITGVSGSGKSSLLMETLYPLLSNRLMKSELKGGPYTAFSGIEFLDKVISIDQSPIGRTPRSNPSTYTKIFDEIRRLFATLPESKAKGWKEGRFSFNVKEGSCPECGGMGMIQIDMDFLEPAFEECPVCHGFRFDKETLSVRWKGKSIQDVLTMTFEEALLFFADVPHIHKKIALVCKVGLSYLTLGQPSNTLSGGEAQRIKIAKELTRPDSGKTLYLLDEPTTGLHFHDMQALIHVLHDLVDRGNTVVVIEHNMDLVQTVDWVIDLGPGSGDEGGHIIAQGSPLDITKSSTPTALALQRSYEKRSHREEAPLSSHMSPKKNIRIVRAQQNNLKNISVEFPRNSLTLILGPSGSGKSSLALETLYAEGQRRFVESLSPYMRQFLHPCPQPKVEYIEGLSPTISLEKRHHMVNPRSTVGTMTETYEYLRILFAKAGVAHSPTTKEIISSMNADRLADLLLADTETALEIRAPLGSFRIAELHERLAHLLAQGYTRIALDGERYSLSEALPHFKESRKKRELHVIVDRLLPTEEKKGRIRSSLQEAARLSQEKVLIVRGETETAYTFKSFVSSTGETFPEVNAQTFAFNTAEGMCPDCKGLGFQWGLDLERLPLSKNSSPFDLLSLLIGDVESRHLAPLMEQRGISPYLPLYDLSKQEKTLLLKGAPVIPGIETEWVGIHAAIEIALKHVESFHGESDEEEQILRQALAQKECASCAGTRLNEFARHVTIDTLSIADVCALPITQSYEWFRTVISSQQWSFAFETVIQEIEKRLRLLCSIGLGYLSLARSATTLSGGEGQRVRLISQIGSLLSHVIYVLDEPTSGLHPRDVKKMYDILAQLKALGNTLVVIEHDKNIISHADWIIELGPEGGEKGGELLFQGTPQDFRTSSASVTAPLLFGKAKARSVSRKKPFTSFLQVEKADVHNLHTISCSIPHEALTTIVGPSGSGKSTLLFDVIAKAARERAHASSLNTFSVSGLEHFQNLIVIDQSFYTSTSRSDVASYVDLLTILRSLYATLPEARMLALEPKHFSMNHRMGMCPHCWGMGYKRIQMYFLAPLKVPCPECKGMRLNSKSLRVHYKGLSLGQFLQLSVQEALPLLEHLRKAKRILDSLLALGLGYVKLGHEVSSLSNGEYQRLKIAKEFSKQRSRTTLFLLDEPTSGLHIREVRLLIDVLQKLKERGDTIIAVEHKEDFIQSSDWVIELGPGAGAEGGTVLFEGPIRSWSRKGCTQEQQCWG